METVYLAGVLLALLYLMATLSSAPGLKSPVRGQLPLPRSNSNPQAAALASRTDSNFGLRRE